MPAPEPRRIQVRVTPRSKRPGIEIGADGTWQVRVAAPADDGRANAAVIAAVAEHLGVPKNAVSIVRGHIARLKLLAIR